MTIASILRTSCHFLNAHAQCKACSVIEDFQHIQRLTVGNIMEWPGVNIPFRSDSESEAEEFLHENEIAPNIIMTAQTGGNIQTVDLTRTVEQQKSIEKKHQLTIESFSELAPRSKLAEERKIRRLGDDKRRKKNEPDVKCPPKVNAPPVGKKKTQPPRYSDPAAVKK